MVFGRAMVSECRRGIPACEGRALRVWMAALVLTPLRLVVFMPVVDLMGRVVQRAGLGNGTFVIASAERVWLVK